MSRKSSFNSIKISSSSAASRNQPTFLSVVYFSFSSFERSLMFHGGRAAVCVSHWMPEPSRRLVCVFALRNYQPTKRWKAPFCHLLVLDCASAQCFPIRVPDCCHHFRILKKKIIGALKKNSADFNQIFKFNPLISSCTDPANRPLPSCSNRLEMMKNFHSEWLANHFPRKRFHLVGARNAERPIDPPPSNISLPPSRLGKPHPNRPAVQLNSDVKQIRSDREFQ